MVKIYAIFMVFAFWGRRTKVDFKDWAQKTTIIIMVIALTVI